MVFTTGLLFYVVLTMISGARELLTPGVWEKQGTGYRLRGDPTAWLSEEERRQAESVRMQVLRNIGNLARGEGAERYRSLGADADPALAREDAPLLGTPDEITARLERLAAGGVDYVLLVDPTGSRDALEMFAREIMPRFS